MAESDEPLRQWDCDHVWHAFTQMAEYEPLIIERGSGAMLYDTQGRGYLDGTSSLWCNVHGHAHPVINAALHKQLERIAHTTNLGASNPTTIRLARRLVELAPGNLPHVFFSDNGATAVEIALKMAMQYWRQRPDPRPEKTLYAALGDAYHGDTLGGVSVSGVERFQAMFRPLLFETLRIPSPRHSAQLRALDEAQLTAHYLEQLEQTLQAHHAQLAALVIEPLVQGAAGMVMQPRGYLQGLAQLARRYEVLLIADEVAVGFGRTGTMFACEQEGVVPDLLCLAKGLTGGYLPMAATLASSEIYSAFLGPTSAQRQFFHGHTYGGNPLAAAAALASLELFETEQVLERLPAKIARLAEHLERLARLPQVAEVRQRGLIAAVELADQSNSHTAPSSSKAPEHRQTPANSARQVCLACRERGVLLRPLGNVVPIIPPLCITGEELDQLAEALYGAIAALAE